MQREPFGMVALPILMLVVSGGKWCFGYAHAPIDPVWAYRHPKKAALMSAAGPLANLLLATIMFIVLYSIARPDGDTMIAIRKIAGVFLFLNLVLFVFNPDSIATARRRMGRARPLPPLTEVLRRADAHPVHGPHHPDRALLQRRRVDHPVWSEVNSWLPYSLYRTPNIFG